MGFSIVNGAPPKESALTDTRGRVTAPWFSYLVSLQKSNSGVVVGLGGLDLNGQIVTGSATFNGPIYFGVAPTFGDAPGTRANLGLGSAATQPSSAFDAAGAAAAAQAAAIAASLQRASNLSDLGNVATARTNLGLGSAATQPSSAFDAAGAATAAQAAAIAASLQRASNLSDLANVATARTNLGVPVLAGANAFTGSQTMSNTGASCLLTVTGNLNTGFGGWTAIADGAPFLSGRMYGSTATTVLAGITLANWAVMYHNSGSGLLIQTANAAPLVFGTSNLERARLVAAGRLLLGTTTDDGVNLLQVAAGASFAAGVSFTAPQSIVFGSGWVSWTPTYSASGSMTATQNTLYAASYCRVSNLVFVQFYCTVSLGGTASNQVNISLPVSASAALTLQTLACTISPGGSTDAGLARINGSTTPGTINIIPRLGGNFTLGLTDISFSGVYRV
jgi:hypothetical protein